MFSLASLLIHCRPFCDPLFVAMEAFLMTVQRSSTLPAFGISTAWFSRSTTEDHHLSMPFNADLRIVKGFFLLFLDKLQTSNSNCKTKRMWFVSFRHLKTLQIGVKTFRTLHSRPTSDYSLVRLRFGKKGDTDTVRAAWWRGSEDSWTIACLV